MTIVFSMGYGHGGQSPDLERVLDTMASDSAGFENTGDVGSWASEYGYESREARKKFRQVERQAKLLRRFLGDDAYETLLWRMGTD